MSANSSARGRRSFFAVLFISLTAFSTARAQPPTSSLDRELGFLEAEDVAKIPVTVASRGPAIPAGQAPAVVDVITSEEIRTSGARTLAELLEQRVGIDVATNRVVPRGLNTAPSQGLALFNNRTLLLIDGRPTNGVFFGEFLSGREFPLEHIARIEVIRGPGSSLYGTNAMAGVINVVTKDAADAAGIAALAQGGTHSTRRFDFLGGIGGPRLNGNFFLHHFGTGGANELNRNDNVRTLYAFGRSTVGPITLEAEAMSFSQETPGTEGNPTPADRINRERYSIGASLSHPLGERFQLAGRAYANVHQTRFLVLASDIDRRKYDEHRFGQELSLNYRPWEWLAITFGGEVREEGGEVGPLGCVRETDGVLVGDPNGCELDQQVYAVFLEDQIGLPWNLTLNAGARYDRVTLTDDDRVSPRVNLLWRPADTTSVKVGYGEAFRAPSFFELRGGQRTGATSIVVGNPNLGSEVVRTVDGEITHRFSRAINLRLGGFYTRGIDLITQQTEAQLIGLDLDLLGVLFGDPLFTPILQRRFTFINSDNVTVAGAEIAMGGVLDFPVPGEVAYGVNYTFQETNNETLRDTDLPFSPKNKVNVVIDYRPLGELSVYWHMRWLDRQYSSAANEDEIPSYFDHNLNLVYRFTRELEVALGVYNITGDDHHELAGVPREPRTFLASIAYRFRPRPPLPDLSPRTPVEPAALTEARAAIERARAAGAEEQGNRAYKEAVAHLSIAEELYRRAEDESRVLAAAELARDAAETARTSALTRPTPEPTPVQTAGLPAVTAIERPTTAPVRRTPAPSSETPASRRTAEPGVSPSPTRMPTATPTPTSIATAIPTLDLRSARVLLLQSDGEVGIYRETATALVGSLPARVELHDLRGDRERGATVLASQAANNDLVVAIGSLAATLSRESVADRPVLFCAVLNPERYALSAPNVAGVRFEVSAATQLRRMRRALPAASRIGVLYDPAKSEVFVAEAERAAAAIGLQLVKAVVRDPRDVPFVFRSIRQDIDVLWMIADSTVVTRESFEVLALQTAESKIPLVAFAEAFARQGALLALYPDPSAVGAQCAALAVRLLRGEISPSEIGVRDPDRPRLAVNRRIEDQLAISLPSGLDADVEIR